MKKILGLLALVVCITVNAQNKNAKAILKVSGVCGMCKARIEKTSIKIKGVKSAVWSIDTQELQLVYDERKTNLQDIKEEIIAVGHDTEELKAPDSAYSNLDPCCRYRDDTPKHHPME